MSVPAVFDAARRVLRGRRGGSESVRAYLKRISPLLAKVTSAERGFSPKTMERWIYGVPPLPLNMNLPQAVAIGRVAHALDPLEGVPPAWLDRPPDDVLLAFSSWVELSSSDDEWEQIVVDLERHAVDDGEAPLTGLLHVGSLHAESNPRRLDTVHTYLAPVGEEPRVVREHFPRRSGDWHFIPPAPPGWDGVSIYPTEWIQKAEVQELMRHYIQRCVDALKTEYPRRAE